MKKLGIAILTLCAACAAWAQTNLETQAIQAMSLDDCVKQALEHNFDVRIERMNPQISELNLRAAYGGYDPVFSISGEHDYTESGGSISPGSPANKSTTDNISSSIGGALPSGATYSLFGNASENNNGRTNFFDSSGGQLGIRLTQPLLKNFWIDGTRLSIRVSRISLKSSEQGLRLRFINTITAVEQAYYGLIAARENVKVQQSALELAERLLDENKKRVEVGSMAPLDQKQAESQLASSRADLISAQRALTAQENILKSLLTDDYRKLHDIDIVPTESLTAPLMVFNLQESWSKGIKLRPDLQQAKLDLERQGIQLKYDFNQLFPALNVFGSYGHGANSSDLVDFGDSFNQMGNGDRPFYTIGASVTVPLSNVGPRNNYKATKLTVQQAQLAVKQFEQNVLIQIDDAVKQAQSDYERVDATRAAREFAEAALDAEKKKLDSGKSTSFVVLQLQKDLTSARSAEISALSSYNKSLAALSQVEGSTLDRRGVNVQMVK